MPRKLAVLAAVSLAAMAVIAMPAHAGTYPLRACNVPGQPPAGTGPWSWQFAAGTASVNDCASGGPFGLAFVGGGVMTRGSGAYVHLTRPEGSGISISQFKLWMRAELSGTGSQLFSALEGVTGGVVQTTSIFAPPGGDATVTPVVSPTYPVGTERVDLLLYCSGSSAENCTGSSSRPNQIFGAEATLFENDAPSIQFGGGTLLASGPRSGEQSLHLVASDGASGIAQVQVYLGSTLVVDRNFRGDRTTCRYESWNACDTNFDQILNVDTRGAPDGSQSVLVRVVDAAGNERSMEGPTPIAVANAGLAGPAEAKLTAGFGVRRSRSRIVKNWSATATVRGRLTSLQGVPIGGAAIDITETAATASRRQVRRPPVPTSEDGTFRYKVKAYVASRKVRFTYVKPGTQSAGVTRELNVRVRPAAKLAVKLRRTLVRYSGQIKSRPIPSRGKSIWVQGRARGGAWQTFAKRQVGRSGRLRGRYRLRVYRPGVQLEFRLRVPPQDGYPYTAGTSAAVKRRVR